eukprot:4660455-Alexandrium_andersonii.AAC.1
MRPGPPCNLVVQLQFAYKSRYAQRGPTADASGPSLGSRPVGSCHAALLDLNKHLHYKGSSAAARAAVAVGSWQRSSPVHLKRTLEAVAACCSRCSTIGEGLAPREGAAGAAWAALGCPDRPGVAGLLRQLEVPAEA